MPDAAQPMNASNGSSSRSANSSMSVWVVISRRVASAASRVASCSIVIEMPAAHVFPRCCCSRSSRLGSSINAGGWGRVSLGGRDVEFRDRELRGPSDPAISGEQWSVEVAGQDDINGVVDDQVVPVGPRPLR